ncbi:Indoleamine 2,3-dioxygenase [Fistulina hepatica ATCC 64428]|uniref:Indoleamine 2,3-dioxygenase n=1 Tax=Fistulina hepatica ATCC 64428 TaxID=1128425 RepID=A0A0D7AK65_9AGAR|nr:Indoleamine 2,3-dioxygenase [Fistulina hepatica ATCC 64428]
MSPDSHFDLPPDHFLSFGRPIISGAPDNSTLAAHDFDVDNRTGFMPPHPPLSRLSADYEPWEQALDDAVSLRLRLGDSPNITGADRARSEAWRDGVRQLPVLPLDALGTSEVALRRAHHVLTFIMHFYIHSLPPDAPVVIPRPITLPLFRVCAQLDLPPVLTYSDNVLYNWDLKMPSSGPAPALDNLRSQTMFTGTNDEQEFYLTSSRMELRGVEALNLMRMSLDEAFVGDAIAVQRIAKYLTRLATVIGELETLLMAVREGCDPQVFYREIRPWFRGADSGSRPWVFEGLEEDATLRLPTEISGPSAGQSALIHALDTFLGVDKYSHSTTGSGASTSTVAAAGAKTSFLERMQEYMPRYHRAFLKHLATEALPLRALVLSGGDASLLEAYNAAVLAMKKLRDNHMIIVALYIIGPSRRVAASGVTTSAPPPASFLEDFETEGEKPDEAPLKGTGGSDLVKFLKGVRDLTAGAVIAAPAVAPPTQESPPAS